MTTADRARYDRTLARYAEDRRTRRDARKNGNHRSAKAYARRHVRDDLAAAGLRGDTNGDDLMLASLHHFFEQWMTLPPLVRASVADNLIRYALEGEMFLYYRADPTTQQVIADSLPRRHAVHERFRAASRMLRDLATSLAYHADCEADDRGIDADTGGAS